MVKLLNQANEAPQKPGVYRFLNKDGKVLYVGKAKNLRSRLKQYTSGQDKRTQLPFLLEEAAGIEYTVVQNELESLLLENTLIKEYYPPYNIKLKDDKNYAFIKIDYSTQIPQIIYVRKVEKDNGTYFGPFSSVKQIRLNLDYIRKVFKFCANKEISKRPCFYYYLHRCPGVCVGEISLEEYNKQLHTIKTFLSGKVKETQKELQKFMNTASRQKKYELAAKYRDQLQSLEGLQNKQSVVLTKNVDWDIVGSYSNQLETCVTLLKVRAGYLSAQENFIYTNPDSPKLEFNVLSSFCAQYYTDTTDVPTEIILESKVSEEDLIQKLLQKTKQKKVKFIYPKQGQKLDLIKLSQANAGQYLTKWQSDKASNLSLMSQVLLDLQELLKLPTKPLRIECYDISNIQGTNPVGSMVVFENGLPAKNQYRKFKITGKNTPDDFAMMQEMLTRRVKHITNPDIKTKWPTPDLIIIDGGKGQLGVASQVLKTANLNIPVVGLAKRIEEIFKPNAKKSIVLPHSNAILQLFQRLRDEAHRFGITFHRSLRSKQAVKSALDSIPGIGPKTKKLLKQKIGTVSDIKRAPIDQLISLLGKTKAEQLKKHLL